MEHFVWGHRPSIAVQFVRLGMSLVSVGGKSLKDLREDIYDNARNSSTNSVDIDGVYAIALSGGEPYSVWK